MSIGEYDIFGQFRDGIADLLVTVVKTQFPEIEDAKVSGLKPTFIKLLSRPKIGSVNFDLCVPCFPLGKLLGVKNGKEVAAKLAEGFQTLIATTDLIESVTSTAAYVNILFPASTVAAKLLPAILEGKFLAPRSGQKLDKVMVEYSQPNTHKAFHVGHMRNAALGDCLVRLYEQLGHEVIACNYFGDEGAHIAKCLWLLNDDLKAGKVDLEAVDPTKRGEFLGGYYSKAVQKLNLEVLTSLPFQDIFAAKVLSKDPHPAEDAPKNWHLCKVQLATDKIFDVVCGGDGYNAGDIIAYVPVGAKYKGKIVEPRDMKGIASNGVIMGRGELGMAPLPKPVTEEVKAPEPVPEPEPEPAQKGKKGKKGKKKKAKKPKKVVDHGIFVLPADTEIGKELAEVGALDDTYPSVVAEYKKRHEEVRAMLRRMEESGPEDEIVQLWEKTKGWSLDEFHRIYAWLGSRFDHEFFESEVGEESRQLVIKAEQDGILKKSNGAIIADLQDQKLGVAVLLKSNGAGLYATKDLSLAQKKFETFAVDKSIYVVDAGQTLHFKQVFKVLEMLGYEQAKKCVHLPYGLVVLPYGKMSSRASTVIVFNDLVALLDKQITADYLKSFEGVWSPEEIAEALRTLSVAVIKYGMLNHEVNKNIVFKMKDWCGRTGDTGPYMLYAYARITSILREHAQDFDLKTVDYSTVTRSEQLLLLSMAGFWDSLDSCAARNNPSTLCGYLFHLAKAMSSWYELDTSHIGKCQDAGRKGVMLALIKAVSEVLKKGLSILGIPVLERM